MSRFTIRNPVLLIHGIDGSTYAFRTMMPHLRDLGWNVGGSLSTWKYANGTENSGSGG